MLRRSIVFLPELKADSGSGPVVSLRRTGAEADKIELARRELAKGIGIGKVARAVGLGVGTVHRLKREWQAAG